MTYHVHWTGEIVDLDLGPADGRLPGEIITWNPETGKWETGLRVNWRNVWTLGENYVPDDMSRDGIFLGIANTPTSAPIQPILTGIPFWPTDGGTFGNLFQLLGAKVGNQYTMAEDGVVASARVNIPVENVALLVTVSFHINNVQVAETTYVPRVSGIHVFTIAPAFVFIGDIVDIEVDTVKQTGNTQVHYLEDVDYWLTYSNSMFSSVVGLFDEVPNNNGYDIDLEFQPAIVSPDWDIAAVSSANLIPDSQLRADERLWVETSTDQLTTEFISTTDMAWTEIGRYFIADLSAVRGTSWVTGTRTDGTLEAFYYESRALIYRDGATITVQTAEIAKLTPHPTVDFRSTVVGNDLIFEVRGSAIIAQDWDWKMIYFVRDIT